MSQSVCMFHVNAEGGRQDGYVQMGKHVQKGRSQNFEN